MYPHELHSAGPSSESPTAPDLQAWAARIVSDVTTRGGWIGPNAHSFKELEAFVLASSHNDPALLQNVADSLRKTLADSVHFQRDRLTALLSTEAAASVENLVNYAVSTRLLEHVLISQSEFDAGGIPPVSASMRRAQPDPQELLSARDLGQALGSLSDETVRNREKKEELFSILKPGRQRGREYPAFQAWPDIAGEPMTAVMGALGRSRSALAFGFFATSNEVLGGLTPVEVLVGKVGPGRPISAEAMQLLLAPKERRLAAVVEAAKAHAGSADA